MENGCFRGTFMLHAFYGCSKVGDDVREQGGPHPPILSVIFSWGPCYQAKCGVQASRSFFPPWPIEEEESAEEKQGSCARRCNTHDDANRNPDPTPTPTQTSSACKLTGVLQDANLTVGSSPCKAKTRGRRLSRMPHRPIRA